jgi:hypothetical protein
MLLDLGFNFKNLDGEEIESQSAAKLVANILCQKPEGVEVLKAAIWFPELYKNGKLEIDKVDLEVFEKFVKKLAEIPQGGITVLAWAQIQEAIDRARVITVAPVVAEKVEA